MKIRVGIVYVLMLLLTAQGVDAGASNPPEECGRALSKVLSSELDKAKPAAYLRNQIAQALVSERRVLFNSPIFIRAFEVALLKMKIFKIEYSDLPILIPSIGQRLEFQNSVKGYWKIFDYPIVHRHVFTFNAYLKDRLGPLVNYSESRRGISEVIAESLLEYAKLLDKEHDTTDPKGFPNLIQNSKSFGFDSPDTLVEAIKIMDYIARIPQLKQALVELIESNLKGFIEYYLAYSEFNYSDTHDPKTATQLRKERKNSLLASLIALGGSSGTALYFGVPLDMSFIFAPLVAGSGFLGMKYVQLGKKLNIIRAQSDHLKAKMRSFELIISGERKQTFPSAQSGHSSEVMSKFPQLAALVTAPSFESPGAVTNYGSDIIFALQELSRNIHRVVEASTNMPSRLEAKSTIQRFLDSRGNQKPRGELIHLMDSKFEQLANDLATHQNNLHDLKLQAQLAIETLNRINTYLENELLNLGNQKPAIAELLNSKKQLFEKFAVLYRNLNQLLENGFNLDTLIINQLHELALLVSSVSPNSPLTPAELEILGKLNDSMSIK